MGEEVRSSQQDTREAQTTSSSHRRSCPSQVLLEFHGLSDLSSSRIASLEATIQNLHQEQLELNQLNLSLENQMNQYMQQIEHK